MPIDLEALARLIDSGTHPANPAPGEKEAKNSVLHDENPCRVGYPAPTRQAPAEPGTPPRVGEVSGGVGWVSGGVPDRDFADKDGHKPRFEGGLSGLPGGFSGGHVATPEAGVVEVAGLPEGVEGFELHYIPEVGPGMGELLDLLMRQPVLGVDLETTGLDPHTSRPRLLSLAMPGAVVVFDLFGVPLEVFYPLFSREEGPLLVGHNLKFDLLFLLKAGVWRASGKRLWDTGLAHQVLHAQARMPALKDLAPGLDKTLQTSDWGGPLSSEQVAYAGLDAVVPLSLYGEQKKRARAMGLEKVLEVEHRALPAVAWMELRGVPFAPELWEEAAREAEREAEALRGELPFGVNWNSPAQVLAYLKGEGLDLPDTREDTLAGYREHPLVAKLLRYREAAKRVSTYGKEWAKHLNPATGRIHPSWQQIGAETGRMACRKPNLQQVPRDPALRRAFRPKEGRVMLKADFSQIELRIAAAIAKEGRMLRAFREGKDLHALTASLVLGKPLEEVGKEGRQLAKALNFGLLYGLGAEGLRRYALTAYGVKLTLEEAQKLRDAFFRAYPALKRWHRSQPEGEVVVRTLLGRRRTTDRYTEKLNTPVQGTGADGLKMALALLWENRALLWKAFPVLAVHDELVLEAPEEGAREYLEALTALMRQGMEEVLGGAVPVEVEGGIYRDWGATPWEEA